MAIDLKASRFPVHRRDIRPSDTCPRCSSRLQQLHASYIVGTQPTPDTLETFICGSDFGWFCDACPTIVLDDSSIERMLRFAKQLSPGSRYGVVGLADLDSLSEEERDMPLGSEDHPLPLIPFLEEPPPVDETQRKMALLLAKKAKKKRQREKRSR